MRSALKYLILGSAVLVAGSTVAVAQEKVELIYSDTTAGTDVRAIQLEETFKPCLAEMFDFKAYHQATLFKQGTELTAMQRGNLDMASLAVADFYNQVPESSLLAVAYLYSGYDHMRRVWASGVLDDLIATMEEKAKIKLLTNVYIGTRQLNLRGDKKIMTPDDLAGVKLRMPGGEVWQFIGEALGANPTPVAFTEVYTALQTGAVDGQDNALPADKTMKFYEVTDQIILTNHYVANNLFSIARSKWDSLSAEQQDKLMECSIAYRDAAEKIFLQEEAELADFFRAEGLTIYDPDRDAFRSHVLDKYLNSKYAADWPEGLLDKINAIK